MANQHMALGHLRKCPSGNLLQGAQLSKDLYKGRIIVFILGSAGQKNRCPSFPSSSVGIRNGLSLNTHDTHSGGYFTTSTCPSDRQSRAAASFLDVQRAIGFHSFERQRKVFSEAASAILLHGLHRVNDETCPQQQRPRKTSITALSEFCPAPRKAHNLCAN